MSAPCFAILGTDGHVPDPTRFDDAGLLAVLGGNAGNLMFQHAVTRLLDADLVHISPAFTPYSDTAALRPAQALVFPAANHLRAGADWTGLNNYLAGCGKPLVLLGLGAQAPRPDGDAETIATLCRDPHVQRMADILREKAALVTVRGPFSARVCEALGLRGVEVLGCPSALLNPDADLGARIAAALAELPARIGRGPIRSCLTAAAPFEIAQDTEKRAVERRLFNWFGGLYVQQSGGIDTMRAARGDWALLPAGAQATIARTLAPDADPQGVGEKLTRSGRFFTSAPDWIGAMADCDLAIGTRLHGTMAALAAGCPGVVIIHDSRTAELAETMQLPRLTMAEVLAALDAASLIASVRFDGRAFDLWRADAAARLGLAFARAGLPASRHLTGLAAQDFIRRTA